MIDPVEGRPFRRRSLVEASRKGTIGQNLVFLRGFSRQ